MIKAIDLIADTIVGFLIGIWIVLVLVVSNMTPLAIFLFVGSAIIVALAIYMRKNKVD